MNVANNQILLLLLTKNTPRISLKLDNRRPGLYWPKKCLASAFYTLKRWKNYDQNRDYAPIQWNYQPSCILNYSIIIECCPSNHIKIHKDNEFKLVLYQINIKMKNMNKHELSWLTYNNYVLLNVQKNFFFKNVNPSSTIKLYSCYTLLLKNIS